MAWVCISFEWYNCKFTSVRPISLCLLQVAMVIVVTFGPASVLFALCLFALSVLCYCRRCTREGRPRVQRAHRTRENERENSKERRERVKETQMMQESSSELTWDRNSAIHAYAHSTTLNATLSSGVREREKCIPFSLSLSLSLSRVTTSFHRRFCLSLSLSFQPIPGQFYKVGLSTQIERRKWQLYQVPLLLYLPLALIFLSSPPPPTSRATFLWSLY